MKYCDFIAANIQSALKETELNVGSIQFDLDEDGAFRSTTKKIFYFLFKSATLTISSITRARASIELYSVTICSGESNIL